MSAQNLLLVWSRTQEKNAKKNTTVRLFETSRLRLALMKRNHIVKIILKSRGYVFLIDSRRWCGGKDHHGK